MSYIRYGRAAPRPAEGPRRPAPAAPHGLLAADPGDPAHRLVRRLVDRDAVRRVRRLDLGARRGTAAGRAAPVLLRLHPLRDALLRLPLPGHGAVPAVQRPAARRLSDRHRPSRRPAAAAAAAHPGADLRRDPGSDRVGGALGRRRIGLDPQRPERAVVRRQRHRRPGRLERVPRLVRVPLEGQHAARAQGHRRVRPRLPGPGHRLSPARHREVPELGPARAARGAGAARAAPGAARGRRPRSPPLAPDRVLPAAAADPAPRVGVPVGDSRSAGGVRAVVGAALPRPPDRRVPPVRRPVHPVLVPRPGLRRRRREPVPWVHGRAGQLPARPRPARTRTAEPLEDALPAVPRAPGVPPVDRPPRRAHRVGHPHLVRGALHRPGSRGPPEPLRVGPALPRPGQRVLLPAHRRLPTLEPTRGRRAGSGRDARCPSSGRRERPPGGDRCVGRRSRG